jgi:hypothetical protein
LIFALQVFFTATFFLFPQIFEVFGVYVCFEFKKRWIDKTAVSRLVRLTCWINNGFWSECQKTGGFVFLQTLFEVLMVICRNDLLGVYEVFFGTNGFGVLTVHRIRSGILPLFKRISSQISNQA